MSFDTEDVYVLENLVTITGSNTAAISNLITAVNNASNLAQAASDEANAATALTASTLVAAQLDGGSVGVVTGVTVAPASTTLLSANGERTKCIIYNNDTYPIYITLGGASTTNAFTYKLLNGTGMEIVFKGIITAIAPPTLNSAVVVTEIS